MNPLFYKPLGARARHRYLHVLDRVMEKANLNSIPHGMKEEQIPEVLLALRQRFQIGFSNGCPWPEKAIVEFISEQDQPPSTLEELAVMIRDSAVSDAKHSFLFQGLLRSASEPLREELLSYHPWTRLAEQEDRHLPPEITEPDGKGAYGLAYDPPYFQVLIPLYKYIDKEGISPEVKQARFFAVTDFFETTAKKVRTIDELVQATEEYLNSPQFVEKYLPS